MSRKKAYTEYIVRHNAFGFLCWPNYCQLPRKQKKRIKRYVEKTACYDHKNKRVTFFNVALLSTPVPDFFLKLFGCPISPINFNQTAVFRRYTSLEKDAYGLPVH